MKIFMLGTQRRTTRSSSQTKQTSTHDQMKAVVDEEWVDKWAKAGTTEDYLRQFALMKGIASSKSCQINLIIRGTSEPMPKRFKLGDDPNKQFKKFNFARG